MNSSLLRKLYLLFFAAAVLAGCGQTEHLKNGTSTANSSTSLPITNGNLIYSKDIAPIISRSCVKCHANGGIAPFSLETYGSAKSFGPMIKAATMARTMPPPGVDNSGSCENFLDANWLTDAEIQTLANWVDTGMKDDGALVNNPVPQTLGLTEPKQQIPIPQPYTPQPPPGSVDDYRCFVVDPKISTDTLLTAVDVVPDKIKILHHVITFKPTSPEAEAAAIAKSGVDGRPGYTCFGAAGVPSTVVGLWAPGGDARELKDPETGELLGLRLEANRKLIVQIHYNTTNGAFPDQSAIVIKTNPSAKPVKWSLMVNFNLDLKPGLASIDTPMTQANDEAQLFNNIYEKGLADDYVAGGGILSLFSVALIKEVLFNTPDSRDMKVYAVAPHMHKLGRKINLEKIDSAGKKTCLSNVPKYDFNWQRGYAYKKPPIIKATDKIKLSCNFNTTSRTDSVSFGESTNDEMCVEFLLINAN